MNDLKNCPFCGSKAVLESHNGGMYYIRCTNTNKSHFCPIEPETSLNLSKDQTIWEWNTRSGITIPDHLTEEFKEFAGLALHEKRKHFEMTGKEKELFKYLEEIVG